MFMGAGGGLQDEAAAGVAKKPASGSSFILAEGRGPRQMVPRQTSNTTLIGTREGGGWVRGGGSAPAHMCAHFMRACQKASSNHLHCI